MEQYIALLISQMIYVHNSKIYKICMYNPYVMVLHFVNYNGCAGDVFDVISGNIFHMTDQDTT